MLVRNSIKQNDRLLLLLLPSLAEMLSVCCKGRHASGTVQLPGCPISTQEDKEG